MAFCAVCGNEFTGRSDARFCSASCRVRANRASARERKASELSPAEEQQLRDDAGFTSSESRSKAERDAAALRMVERMKLTEEEREIIAGVLERQREREAEHDRKVREAMARATV